MANLNFLYLRRSTLLLLMGIILIGCQQTENTPAEPVSSSVEDHSSSLSDTHSTDQVLQSYSSSSETESDTLESSNSSISNINLSQGELDALLSETKKWVTQEPGYENLFISFGSFSDTDTLFGTAHNHYIVVDSKQSITINSDGRSFDVPYKINESLPSDAVPYYDPTIHFTIGQENGMYYLDVIPPLPTGYKNQMIRYYQTTS